jgi:iron complex outermembrane receptor protein
VKKLQTIFIFSLLFISWKSFGQYHESDSLQVTDSVHLLEDVKVVAYRFRGRVHTLPGNLAVKSSESLRLPGGTNFAEAVNTIPGVTMQSGTFATSRIVIRGMGSRTPYNTNRIRAYLNEIPITDADGVSAPEEIDLQNLDRIEVIKGPSSALYGSGLGGSINLYTPVKKKNSGNFNTHFESFGTYRNHLSGSLNSGKASLWGSLSQLSSKGYRENNDYNRLSLLTTSIVDQKKWSLNTTLLVTGMRGGIPSSLGQTLFETNPKAAAPNWKAVGGYQKYFKGLGAVSVTNRLSERVSNQLTVFWKFSDNFERRPFNDLDDGTSGGGLRERINYLTSKIDVIAGAEWIGEGYRWLLRDDGVLINRNLENRFQLNVFSLAYYKPVPKVNISAGAALNSIRYSLTDRFEADGDQSGNRSFPLIFSPRIGLNYAPGDRLAFYASAGHGFSLPSPEETLLPQGNVNPGIKPEKGMQYETGIRLHLPFHDISAELSLYDIELSNLLLTKRLSEDIFTGINAGRTRHQGIELSLQNTWFESSEFPGRLLSIIGYTRSLNRFIRFTDNDVTFDGNHLPGIPDQVFNLQLLWDMLKKLRFSGNFHYTGEQYLNDANNLKYGDYFICDLKATLTLGKAQKSLSIYSGVNNVSNVHYASMLIVNALGVNNAEPRYYYPGLPRHYYVGVIINI